MPMKMGHYCCCSMTEHLKRRIFSKQIECPPLFFSLSVFRYIALLLTARLFQVQPQKLLDTKQEETRKNNVVVRLE